MTSSSSIQPTSFLRRVLMADAGISAAVGALMAAGAGPLQRLTGLPASTPVAVIQNATLPGQRHMTTTLDDLASAVTREGLGSPAVLVVGDVIKGVDVAMQQNPQIRAAL